ncbi:hypothetical protein EJ02DRAFT_417263 [Clathrospora elynae]|uniref:Uncharacterized protein n=1 Tax=Clathrospora elynae TaxID=706981 RepID=A0A6A5T456_9PLEO|nr:hypothetical protein EJ02DRAFT_417263 [Clathrospora elynae]
MPAQPNNSSSSAAPGSQYQMNGWAQQSNSMQVMHDTIEEVFDIYRAADEDRRECRRPTAPTPREQAPIPTPQTFQFRREPVGSPSQRTNTAGISSVPRSRTTVHAAAAQASVHGLRHGRNDAVMHGSPNVNIRPAQQNNGTRPKSNLATLQLAQDTVAEVVANALPPLPPLTAAALAHHDRAQARKHHRTAPIPSPYTHSYNIPYNRQQSSYETLPHTLTFFDRTTFTPFTNDDDRNMRGSQYRSNRDSMMPIEAQHLDSDVAPHLRKLVDRPYVALWDRVVHAMRYAVPYAMKSRRSIG